MGNFAENLNLGNRFRPPCTKVVLPLLGAQLKRVLYHWSSQLIYALHVYKCYVLRIGCILQLNILTFNAKHKRTLFKRIPNLDKKNKQTDKQTNKNNNKQKQQTTNNKQKQKQKTKTKNVH